MKDYILEEINSIDADGVDFITMTDAYFKKQFNLCQIICSYTKEQWVKNDCKYIPKTPRLYWKMIDGNKAYLE